MSKRCTKPPAGTYQIFPFLSQLVKAWHDFAAAPALQKENGPAYSGAT